MLRTPPTEPGPLVPRLNDVRKSPIDLCYDEMVETAAQHVGESMMSQWKAIQSVYVARNPGASQLPMHLCREAINAANSNFLQLRGSNAPVAFQCFQFIPSNHPQKDNAHKIVLTPSQDESYMSVSGSTRAPANPIKVVADSETASCGSAIGVLTANMAAVHVEDDCANPALTEKLEYVIAQTSRAVNTGNIKAADYSSVGAVGTPVFLKASHYKIKYELGISHHTQMCQNGYANIARTVCAAALCLGVSAETRPYESIAASSRLLIPTASAFNPPVEPSDGRIIIPVSIVSEQAVDAAIRAYRKAGADRVWMDPEGTGKYATVSKRASLMLQTAAVSASSPAVELGRSFAHHVRRAYETGPASKEDTIPNQILEGAARQLTALSREAVKRIKDVPIIMVAYLLDQFAVAYPSEATAMAGEAAGSSIPLAVIVKRRLGHATKTLWLSKLQAKFDAMKGPVRTVLTTAMTALMHKAKITVPEAEFYKKIPDMLAAYANKASPEAVNSFRSLMASIGASQYIASFRQSKVAAWDPVLYMSACDDTWSDIHAVFEWFKVNHVLIFKPAAPLVDKDGELVPDDDVEWQVSAHQHRDAKMLSWKIHDPEAEAVKDPHFLRVVVKQYIEGKRVVRMAVEQFKAITNADNVLPLDPLARSAFIFGVKTNIHARVEGYATKQSITLNETPTLSDLSVEDRAKFQEQRTIEKYTMDWDRSPHGEPADVGMYVIALACRVMRKKYKMSAAPELYLQAVQYYREAFESPQAVHTNAAWYREVVRNLSMSLDHVIETAHKRDHDPFVHIAGKLIDVVMYTYADTASGAIRVPSLLPYALVPKPKDSIIGAMSKSLAKQSALDTITVNEGSFEEYDYGDHPAVSVPSELIQAPAMSPSMVFQGIEDPYFDEFHAQHQPLPAELTDVLMKYHTWKLRKYPDMAEREAADAELDRRDEDEERDATISM